MDYGGYGGLKIVVVHINLLILIILKNGPYIVNTRSNFTFVLYLYKNFPLINLQ